jgi:hypothetical protein
MGFSQALRVSLTEALSREADWPAPVLPLKRRTSDGEGPETGIVLPQYVVKMYGLPELPNVVVIKENMFMLRAATLLATPRDVYSTSEWAEDAGWIVD